MTEELESNILNDTDLEKLKEAIRFYRDESMRLKDLIENSQTTYKKKFYRKKLKNNNQIFSKYLYLYDKVINKSNEQDIPVATENINQ